MNWIHKFHSIPEPKRNVLVCRIHENEKLIGVANSDIFHLSAQVPCYIDLWNAKEKWINPHYHISHWAYLDDDVWPK